MEETAYSRGASTSVASAILKKKKKSRSKTNIRQCAWSQRPCCSHTSVNSAGNPTTRRILVGAARVKWRGESGSLRRSRCASRAVSRIAVVSIRAETLSDPRVSYFSYERRILNIKKHHDSTMLGYQSRRYDSNSASFRQRIISPSNPKRSHFEPRKVNRK